MFLFPWYIIFFCLFYILDLAKYQQEVQCTVDNFKQLLGKGTSAIVETPANKYKYNKCIAIIKNKCYENMKRCFNSNEACSLYKQYSKFTSVMREGLNAKGVTIDGELPGAVSTSCSFRIIFDDGVKVFKYPTDATDKKVESEVLLDARACEILKMKNKGILPDGIVEYVNHTIKLTGGETLYGTLSKMYLLSLDSVQTPIADVFALKILTKLFTIITNVHKLDYVLGDVKPGNIYIDADEEVFIGDLETMLLKNTCGLLKYTGEFLPEDLIKQDYASCACDWYCLINTGLEFLNLRPQTNTIADIVDTVTSMVNHNEVQKLLKTFMEMAKGKIDGVPPEGMPSIAEN